MKLKKEEVQEMLAKAIGGVFTEENSNNNDEDRISKVEKSISGLSKQISTLAELAANGFEKPKTTEEIIKEAISPILKDIAELKKGETEDSSQPIPQTKGELATMMKSVIEEALKGHQEPNKPKAKGKDDLNKSTEDDIDLDDVDADDLIKGINDEMKIGNINITEDLAKENEDAAGNPLTKQQKIKRAQLDDYFGKIISGSAKMNSMAKSVDDEDDEDDEDDN